ncbi:MAG: ribosomal-processing cysteine protease Prp [Oscillospiraceae bacterium]|nr:ribosomal-processing cysteine protease Prp [Oscillospiraceae bacterium]
MTKATFFSKSGKLYGFSVSGHTGYGVAGRDILCAAISSAVQMTANGITEILKKEAKVEARGATVTLQLENDPDEMSSAMIEALKLHLEVLREDHPKNIQISCTEV